MRIVTWNCNGAYPKKHHVIDALQPHIAVVQETSELILQHPLPGATAEPAQTVLWKSDGKRKGIAILVGTGLWLECYTPPNCDEQCFIAARVHGRFRLNVLGVWTKPPRGSGTGAYPRTFLRALPCYENFLCECDSVICGDFNSNLRWDTPSRRSHQLMVDQLAQLGFVSAYHHFTGEPHGSETQCTLHHMHNPEKPYHVDYCFVPSSYTAKLSAVAPVSWPEERKFSDHLPLCVDATGLANGAGRKLFCTT